jgi:hypothetical protein
LSESYTVVAGDRPMSVDTALLITSWSRVGPDRPCPGPTRDLCEWAVPVPLHADLPEPPLDHIAPVLHRLVAEVSEATQTPPDIAFVMALAASGSTGDDLGGQRGDHQRSPDRPLDQPA